MLLNQNKVVDAKSINASLISIKKQIENLNKQAVKLEKELNTLDNDVYTKSEVYNKSEVYTKGETDNAIQTATTSETLWSWIKGKCATVVQSGNANPVTSGAVKSELDTNYYNKQSVDNKIAEYAKTETFTDTTNDEGAISTDINLSQKTVVSAICGYYLCLVRKSSSGNSCIVHVYNATSSGITPIRNTNVSVTVTYINK